MKDQDVTHEADAADVFISHMVQMKAVIPSSSQDQVWTLYPTWFR